MVAFLLNVDELIAISGLVFDPVEFLSVNSMIVPGRHTVHFNRGGLAVPVIGAIILSIVAGQAFVVVAHREARIGQSGDRKLIALAQAVTNSASIDQTGFGEGGKLVGRVGGHNDRLAHVFGSASNMPAT